MLLKIHGTNSFIENSCVVLTSNVKTDQCCPQLRIFILMVRLYIHTYHPRFIPEGVAEASQIFLRDTHVIPKLVSYEKHSKRDRWQAHRRLIAVYLRCKCY
jgi:hypothetical protein